MAVRRDREQAKIRARELVEQMTLEEKVSQTIHQAPAIERLGIPAYNWWGEALHGVARAGVATVFPQAIGMAASFDEDLLYKVADVVSTEARAKFNSQQKYNDTDIYKGLTMWSPNVNIFRDPRWGRGHETYGEDPFLSGKLGVAYINGLQGEDPDYIKVAACAKHFAVHSGPEDIRHSFNAEVGEKDFRETYLPAFEACVRDGNVEAVMGAYNRVNGEAACASEVLMNQVLRGEWGFEGHYVSDCWAIADLFGGHGMFENPVDAVALAISTGCDLNCGSCYGHAYDAVIEGKLAEEDLDRNLIRLMTTRILLGLFEENEDVSYNSLAYDLNDSPEHRAFNLEVARHVPVLLKNDGILPLNIADLTSIGVIGPNADNRRALVGNYEGTSSRYTTVLEGIRNYADQAGVRVHYSEGCHLYKEKLSGLGQRNDRISEVRAVCEHSDVIVAVFGLDPGLEGEEGDQGNQFGSGDKPDILLPGIQREVLDTIYASGKPVILIILSGSALALDRDAVQAAAILQGWYPGAEGGQGIADLIFGQASPQAKLPLSFYSEQYAIPEFTDYSMKNRTYRYVENPKDVLYPFGYGLTYSSFRLEATLENEELIRVEVENTGKVAAAETVQVYVQAPANGSLHPRLCALEKCYLEPGESQVRTIALTEAMFQVYDTQGERQIAEGDYVFYVGFGQPDPRSRELIEQQPVELTVSKR